MHNRISIVITFENYLSSGNPKQVGNCYLSFKMNMEDYENIMLIYSPLHQGHHITSHHITSSIHHHHYHRRRRRHHHHRILTYTPSLSSTQYFHIYVCFLLTFI